MEELGRSGLTSGRVEVIDPLVAKEREFRKWVASAGV